MLHDQQAEPAINWTYAIVWLLQLMREAEVHLGQLVNMLRAPGVAALPGTVAIVAVKAAGSIAQQRPFFMNKVLPVLIGLGSAQVAPPLPVITKLHHC